VFNAPPERTRLGACSLPSLGRRTRRDVPSKGECIESCGGEELVT